MYLSPGFANELLHVYYAKELEKVTNPLPQDEDEVLEVYELTLEQAQAAIADGTICDAKTVFRSNLGVAGLETEERTCLRTIDHPQ